MDSLIGLFIQRFLKYTRKKEVQHPVLDSFMERLVEIMTRDAAMFLRDAERRGTQQGLQQGQKQAQIEIAKNLLAENTSLEMIVRVTGLTLNDVESLRDAKC